MTAADRTVRLGFVGDVMLGRLVNERYRERRRPPAAVWGDVIDRLHSLDGRFINLECCLSTRGHPWRRTYRPFHFRADPSWAIDALRAADIDYVSLANNHVMDYEEPAFRDTLDHLDAAGIAHSGAGETIDEALEPAVVDVGVGDDGEDPVTVAVVSLTDNTPEFAAHGSRPGTAHVSIDVDDERTLARAGEAVDRAAEHDPNLLVASLHWGPNMSDRPPDAFRRFARWLVERGVDVIHGHSAHVFQGVEWVGRSLVCYDTGDFVDDYRVDPTLRNDRSFLFEVHVDVAADGDDSTVSALRLHPTQIEDFSAHEADAEAAEWSRSRMRWLSEPFGTSFEREEGALVTRSRSGGGFALRRDP